MDDQEITDTEVAASDYDRFEGLELDGSNPPKVQPVGTKGNRSYAVATADGADSGEARTVIVDGFVKVVAAESLNQGDWFTFDSSGQAAVPEGDDQLAGFVLRDADAGDHPEAVLSQSPDYRRMTTASAGSEQSDTIDISLQQNHPSTDRWIAKVYDPDGTVATDATLDETGNGSLVNNSGGTRLIFDLGSSGDATLSVSDSNNENVHVEIRPLDGMGESEHFELDFD